MIKANRHPYTNYTAVFLSYDFRSEHDYRCYSRVNRAVRQPFLRAQLQDGQMDRSWQTADGIIRRGEGRHDWRRIDIRLQL